MRGGLRQLGRFTALRDTRFCCETVNAPQTSGRLVDGAPRPVVLVPAAEA